MNNKNPYTPAKLFDFVCACFIAAFLEHGFDELRKFDAPRNTAHLPLAESLFELSGLYQRLLTGGPRKPVQKFTVLVDVNARDDAYYNSLANNVANPCERRRALADLVDKIASASPAVIVLDKYFPLNACPKNSPQTIYLQTMIDKVSRTTPLVMGRSIDARTKQLIPSLQVPRRPGAVVLEGLIEFAPDTKRLPLKWAVRQAGEAPGELPGWVWQESLALVAAKAYEPELLKKYPRLGDLVLRADQFGDDAIHPYVSFVTAGGLATYAAGALLCGQNYADVTAVDRRRRCERQPEVLRRLRGKIVVIGDGESDVDVHLSPIGEVAGFILHANYIEALLDERYFKPAHWLANYALGFAIFCCILFALDQAKRFGIILFVATLLGAYLLVYFVVMHLGYYVNPALVSIVWVLFSITHAVLSSLIHGDVINRIRRKIMHLLCKGHGSMSGIVAIFCSLLISGYVRADELRPLNDQSQPQPSGSRGGTVGATPVPPPAPAAPAATATGAADDAEADAAATRGYARAAEKSAREAKKSEAAAASAAAEAKTKAAGKAGKARRAYKKKQPERDGTTSPSPDVKPAPTPEKR